MAFSIEGLIQTAGLTSPPFPQQVIVYGAGNKGRQICAELQARGITVSAVLDARAAPGQQCSGLPVSTPSDWLARHAAAAHAVVLAIHNEHTAVPPILHSLREMGFARVLTPIDLHDAFPDLPFHYWLAPRCFYLPFAGELKRLVALFKDASSKAWLEAVLTFRLSGDYACLLAPDLRNQYHPPDLPRWPEPLRFVDAGAFTGDTLLQLAAAGYGFDAIAAFEPDLDNFTQLVRNSARSHSAICIPCGLAERAKRIGFTAGMGGGSHIDQTAALQITCVALDEALPDFRPNLIKMDVEGAELQALKGARSTISRCRPALALSLYHHPEHLWRIPFLIESWELGYRFHLRGHAQSSFDLVLYALPD